MVDCTPEGFKVKGTVAWYNTGFTVRFARLPLATTLTNWQPIPGLGLTSVAAIFKTDKTVGTEQCCKCVGVFIHVGSVLLDLFLRDLWTWQQLHYRYISYHQLRVDTLTVNTQGPWHTRLNYWWMTLVQVVTVCPAPLALNGPWRRWNSQ